MTYCAVLLIWRTQFLHYLNGNLNDLVMELRALYDIQIIHMNYHHGTSAWFIFAASTPGAIQGPVLSSAMTFL